MKLDERPEITVKTYDNGGGRYSLRQILGRKLDQAPFTQIPLWTRFRGHQAFVQELSQ